MTSMASAIVLFLVSCFYGSGVQVVFHRWPAARRYTFVTVILGVAMVGLAAVPAIGLESVAILAGYFGIAALPVCLAAMAAHTLEDSRSDDEREAREQVRRGLAEG